MTTATATQTVTCRLAQPDEGQLVKSVFTRCYQAPCEWLSWDNLSPHWVIAELDGLASGLVLIGMGRPFGWIECLMVDPSLSQQSKARLVSALEVCAYDVLRAYGATGALCTVGDGNESFHRIVQRRGFVKQGTGTVYLKRLS